MILLHAEGQRNVPDGVAVRQCAGQVREKPVISGIGGHTDFTWLGLFLHIKRLNRTTSFNG
jgi:hypothetical protein